MQDSTYTVFHRLFVVRALCNCSLWFKHPHILEICSYFIAQNVPHAHMDKVSAKWQYISCHWSVKLILDASLTSVRPKLCPIACLHFCNSTNRLDIQKPVNLQYNALVLWTDGTNNMSTKCMMRYLQ